MQKHKLNNIYRNNKSTIDSDRCVRNVQFIVIVFDYQQINRTRRLKNDIEALIEIKQ